MQRMNWASGIAFAILGISLALHGCNLSGSVDEPESIDEVLSVALAKMEQNRCGEAEDLMSKIPTTEDRVKRTRAWVKLCLANVTTDKISSSILAYNSNTENLTIIGDLANKLIPQNEVSLDQITKAIRLFHEMADNNDRAINLAIGNLAKAAAIISRNALGPEVRRTDISVNNCQTTNCTTGSGNCIVNAEGKMSNEDATVVRDSIIEAQKALSGRSSLGEATDLINRLSQDFSAATTNNFTRCFIYNKALSN